MQKLRTQRGITLIALIITIIVMLILVGVSVTVALNGGLFTTAKEATNKTQVEIDKEQLLELALGAINNKGKLEQDKLTQAAEGKFEYDEENKLYTSKSGNKFVVNEWGSVAEAPVYELSGKWQFNDNFENISTTESFLTQEILFTVNGYITEYDYDYETETETEETIYTTHSFSNIRWGYLEWEGTDNDGTYTFCIDYDTTMVYNINTAGGWTADYFHTQHDENIDVTIVDFGTTPQPVSQEFYDWFTANANPVEE